MLKNAGKLRCFLKKHLTIVLALTLLFTMGSVVTVDAENLQVNFDLNGGINMFTDSDEVIKVDVASSSETGKYVVSSEDVLKVNATGKKNCKELLGFSAVKPTEDLASNGSKDEYLAKYPLMNMNDVTPGTTYYALWQSLSATNVSLKYNPNGGEYPFDGNVVVYDHADLTAPAGTSVTIAECTNLDSEPLNNAGFFREGYKFIGWNTAEDGSGTSYSPSDVIVLDDNMILYAQWEVIKDTPTVVKDKETEVTTKDTAVKSVKTGDNANITLSITLMFISLAVMVMMYRKKLKNN